jgi:hypothetical protein
MTAFFIAPTAVFVVFEGAIFGFERRLPILLVEITADLAADEAADHSAGDSRKRTSGATAELIAYDAARHSTDHSSTFLTATGRPAAPQ